MTPNNVSVAETIMTYTREVRQRWGVFITERICLDYLLSEADVLFSDARLTDLVDTDMKV